MAKSRQLLVQLKNHEYPIYIGDNLFEDVDLLRCHVRANQVLIVTNETIAPLYLASIQRAFTSIQCDVVVLADGEEYKNQDSLFIIFNALINHHHNRDTTIIALGGGVVGDIAGFAASTYQRGVRFIQIPTTLLAQVDSSVGGKTAINHLQSKNMLGSFYQPHAVIANVTTLTTLSLREFRAGFGEIIKYGLLTGGDFLRQIEFILSNGLNVSKSYELSNMIEQCCRIKTIFVQNDEREMGQRALLNLGHTFAHALESYSHYQRWLHGEAVAIGLYCAALLSHQLGYFSFSDVQKIEKLLHQAQLPSKIPKDIDLDSLHTFMLNDKKIKNNTLCFILIKGWGDCFLAENVTNETLRYVLAHATETE